MFVGVVDHIKRADHPAFPTVDVLAFEPTLHLQIQVCNCINRLFSVSKADPLHSKDAADGSFVSVDLYLLNVLN